MARTGKRSPFDHTRGLGSAREGVAYWWTQRVTAVALVPLTLWFTASLIAHARGDYDALVLWLRAPVTTILMVLLLIALFYHMALGLQVVIEDYVHTDRIKMPTVMVIHLGCFVLAVAGIIATLRIAFGG
ncbi:MAG: succinate dehydrogenase, hydrophobic membrane anchor protein [Dongiaceae bacterium]